MMKLFYLLIPLILLTGCSAKNYDTVSSSEKGIVVSYNAYGAAPTLTPEAREMAARHCAKFYKEAEYVGWDIPNIMLTEEHHGFECVQGEINMPALMAGVDKAMSSDKATGQLSQYLDCVRASIVNLDDMTSDASTVALAVADVCSGNHSKYVSEVTTQIAFSDEVKQMVRQAIVESAGTKLIPYVLNWRKIVKQGFNQKTEPSESELPNNLYSAGVEISI